MDYYKLLVALVLVTALLMHGYREKNLKYVIVASLLLFAIYGLRDTYHIGGDTKTSYLGNFWRLQGYSWAQVLERANGVNVLFHLMTKAFIVFVSTDYQLYITLISAFVTICFGRLVYKYSPNPLQSILYHFGLLFFVFHFSALKQSIAMAILMLAFDQVIERKPIKFLILTLLAGQFHFPALVFLPAYWIAKHHLGKAYLTVLGISLVITYLFRDQILNWMLNLYSDEEANVSLTDVAFLRTKVLIMIAIVVAAVIFRVPTPEDHTYEVLLSFMGIAILLQTFCGYNNIFERLADYYFQFSVIFIPMVFDRNANRNSLLNWRYLQVADTLAPYVFCGYSIYRFLGTVKGSALIYPFRFYFQS